MADYPNLLQALQSGLTRPGDTSSGIGAQVIGTAIPALNNPYASTSSNLGHTLGASLLGGLLAGYARTQANDDNSELMPVMQQMLTAKTPEDRMALAASNPTRLSPLVQALAMQDFENKQGVDREVAKFNALAPLQRGQKVDNNLIDTGFEQGLIPTDDGLVPVESLGLKSPAQFEADKQKLLAETLNPLDVQKAADVETAKAKAGADFMGYNPERAKAEDDARKYIAEKIPTVRQFKLMQKSIPMLEPLVKADTRSSDVAFVYNYVKALDEGAVREGEIALATTGNSVLQKYAAELQSAFSGSSKLTPRLKEQMLAELKQSQGSLYEQAKKDAAQEISIYTGRGLDENNLYPFDRNLQFGATITPDAALAELKRRGAM